MHVTCFNGAVCFNACGNKFLFRAEVPCSKNAGFNAMISPLELLLLFSYCFVCPFFRWVLVIDYFLQRIFCWLSFLEKLRGILVGDVSFELSQSRVIAGLVKAANLHVSAFPSLAKAASSRRSTVSVASRTPYRMAYKTSTVRGTRITFLRGRGSR